MNLTHEPKQHFLALSDGMTLYVITPPEEPRKVQCLCAVLVDVTGIFPDFSVVNLAHANTPQ